MKGFILSLLLIYTIGVSGQVFVEGPAKFEPTRNALISALPVLNLPCSWSGLGAQKVSGTDQVDWASFEGSCADTTYTVHYKLRSWYFALKNEIRITEFKYYYKSFEVGDSIVSSKHWPDGELICSSTIAKTNIHQKEYDRFISGEYAWRFYNDAEDMTKGQRRYFEANRDSLTSVPGTNLRPLPELASKKGDRDAKVNLSSTKLVPLR